jgi:hypothetical protein
VLNAFAAGRDIYVELAPGIYGAPIVLDAKGKPATPEDKKKRDVCKRTDLSCGYGIGPKALRNTLRGMGIIIDMATAERAVAVYKQRHGCVTRMWDEGDAVPRLLFSPMTDEPKPWLRGIVHIERDAIILPNGVPLRFKLERNIAERCFMRIDGRKATKRRSKIWGGALTGQVVQALARAYLSQTLIRNKEATGLMPLCLRHDEAVYSVPEEKVQASMNMVKAEFCRAPAWLEGCPLDAEIFASKSYSKP